MNVKILYRNNVKGFLHSNSTSNSQARWRKREKQEIITKRQITRYYSNQHLSKVIDIVHFVIVHIL